MVGPGCWLVAGWLAPCLLGDLPRQAGGKARNLRVPTTIMIGRISKFQGMFRVGRNGYSLTESILAGVFAEIWIARALVHHVGLGDARAAGFSPRVMA